MFESIISIIHDFRNSFRIADALDILLVSIVVYSTLIWFKETASRRVLLGVSALLVIYFTARALDMYLTSMAMHAGFAVLLIALVVVFQEDLRRMLERVAAWGSLEQFRPTDAAPLDIDGLVESIFNLAANRTGALVVMRGREPLERHLSGGIDLGGQLSKPLIYSVFDSSSPGHDGAVIIENSRIKKFAAHLPISKNHAELAGRGTRHSAALGLSENCDALTIVVSEERGKVSIAETGSLRTVTSAADLKSTIDGFLEEKFPRQSPNTWRRFIVQNGLLKLLALALSVLAWFVVAYNPSIVHRTFVVPIEYRNLPKTLLLDDQAPTDARVAISGAERDFRFIDPGVLKISINLAGTSAGPQEFAVSNSHLQLPTNLEIYRIEPQVIRLNLRRHPMLPRNVTPTSRP